LDFDAQRQRLRNSFTRGKTGFYTTDWFAEGDLRVLPERFSGLF
jgi:hypothetical protein